MTADEITKLVKEVLSKDPDLLLREYLQQQIVSSQNEIKWHQEKIANLKAEIKTLGGKES